MVGKFLLKFDWTPFEQFRRTDIKALAIAFFFLNSLWTPNQCNAFDLSDIETPHRLINVHCCTCSAYMMKVKAKQGENLTEACHRGS